MSNMEHTLHYNFERRSANFFDWLGNTIKSEKYHQVKATIIEGGEQAA